ncbi:MAG: HlyD family efflux transporter periplasmic adaptor subunit [Magnetococcales bacterium]|nr:HlyD family efflux transporter periplasmic adaptor subunit [Magnetococcales bacterium]
MSGAAQQVAGSRWEGWRGVEAFAGAPEAFWAVWVQAVAECVRAELTVLYVRPAATSLEGLEAWTTLAYWPGVEKSKLPALSATISVEQLAEVRALGVTSGVCLLGSWRVGLLHVELPKGMGEVVLISHLGDKGVAESEVRHWLGMYRALPTLYEVRRLARQHERDAGRLAQAIEWMGRVLECTRFEQAAMVVVHEFAQRFGCETASLCWQMRGPLRLVAQSHSDQVDRRSELTVLLEEAGQEALTQRVEIVWPASGSQVTRAHAQYAALQRSGHLLTLPVVRSGEPVGSVTLERRRMAFSSGEQWALRLFCDLLPNVLGGLEERSHRLWRRVWREIVRTVPERWQPKTRSGTVLVWGLVVVVLGGVWVPVPYSVGAAGMVKTDTMAFVGAPFDGYLESASVRLGETVRAGDPLFGLATRELMLEKAGILADLAQYAREAEKRRSAGQMTEMQIAEAQSAQAAARLKLIEYRLNNAQARSLIDGILVEGEPGKNLGGAVRRGDVVVKVAGLSRLYVEAAVREQDLNRVLPGQSVRVTLLANPEYTYAATLIRMVPSPAIKEGENTFPARLELMEPPPEWWRPGMSCVARIDVGWRPLLWVLTHRLVDYMRMVLWM